MKTVRKTIGQMIQETVQQYPNRDALIHLEKEVRYNYGLLGWDVDRAARGLLSLGLGKGDRVGLWAPNVPEWLVAFLGVARMGAVLVPLDPGAQIEDLRFMLGQPECKAVILSPGIEGQEYVDMVLSAAQDLPSLEHLITLSTESFPDTLPWAELTAMGEDKGKGDFQKQWAEIQPEDPVAIMYTSGTTGRPKGVVLNHLGLINKSLASTERQGITHEDRACLFFPLFHMFGNTCISLASLLRGAALIMPSAVFDPPKILKALQEEKCTAVYGSPSMFMALLENAEFRKKGWASVKRGTMGGAPCPVELMKRLVEEVGVSEITVAYGITEASSWLTMTHPDDPIDLRVGTIGTALPCNEVKIVDPSSGQDLGFGVQGEVCTRGFLMMGYYDMPTATAAAIDQGGWFHTGDLGSMDENGYVRTTGRLKDVIVRKGVPIYPLELEEILYGHPDVAEVQVFGFPHPQKEQEVAAWVRRREGTDLDEPKLAAYLEPLVDPDHLPGQFKMVTGFPMTQSGKVQKFRLAEMAEKESKKQQQEKGEKE